MTLSPERPDFGKTDIGLFGRCQYGLDPSSRPASCPTTMVKVLSIVLAMLLSSALPSVGAGCASRPLHHLG